MGFECFSFKVLAHLGGLGEVMGRLVALVSWCCGVVSRGGF